jgi:hypothetical protein
VYFCIIAFTDTDPSFTSLLSRQNCGLALQNKHSIARDSAGAYPLVLRISVRETSILTLKISKKVPCLVGNLWSVMFLLLIILTSSNLVQDNPVENYKRANKIFNADSQPVCCFSLHFQVWKYISAGTVYLMFLYTGSCLGFFRADKLNINE